MRTLILLLSLLIAAPAWAQSLPLEPAMTGRYSGVDASSWYVGQSGASTTNYLRANGTGAALCVPWDSVVYTRSDVETCWCWSMDYNVTLSAPGANGACNVTDTGGPDGRGACWSSAANEPHWDFPAFGVVPRRPGARGFAGTIGGVCTVATSTTVGLGAELRPPCTATADCTAVVGSGTCEARSSALPRFDGTPTDAYSRDVQRKYGCAFLVWRPISSAFAHFAGKR